MTTNVEAFGTDLARLSAEFLQTATVDDTKHIVKAGGLKAYYQGNGEWVYFNKNEIESISRFCTQHVSLEQQVSLMQVQLAEEAALSLLTRQLV